ncbi:MAG: hypothetical protein ABIA78_03030 [archaeon]
MEKIEVTRKELFEFADGTNDKTIPLEKAVDVVDILPGDYNDTLAVEWEARHRGMCYRIVQKPNSKYNIDVKHFKVID